MQKRIVVADDAAFIREVIKQLLEKNGFSVVGEAADGQEAVDVTLREKPDLVIMDIIMPRKSGIEATREILASLPNTQIIALSTEDGPAMVLKAVEVGCRSHLAKPFLAKNLVTVVKETLGLNPSDEKTI